MENVLHSMAGVAEAAVVGVPDPVLGMAIKAVVVPVEGVELANSDVLRHCVQHLEAFMCPTIVEIRADLPKSEHGKIEKRGFQSSGVTEA